MGSQRPIEIFEIQVAGRVGEANHQVYRWVAPSGRHICADTTSYFSWAPIRRFLSFFASKEDALPAQRIGLGGPGIPGYYDVALIYRAVQPTGIYRHGIVTDVSGQHLLYDGFNIAHVSKRSLTFHDDVLT